MIGTEPEQHQDPGVACVPHELVTAGFCLTLPGVIHGSDPDPHQRAFAQITESQVASLAWALKDALTRLRLILKDPAYNLAFHIAPNTKAQPPSRDWATLEIDFHWHVEVIPRLIQSHGFERGMGFYVNFTPPEEAAIHLREAVPPEGQATCPDP